MVGTFAFPEQIFIFPKFLETLPFKELRSGFAEMLKHGLIADKNHWDQLIQVRKLEVETIIPHIQTSMNIKQDVVDKDFHEQNIRKTLNFGHTIGHAVESLCLQQGNPILHGEAVAMGMIAEAHLAYLENLISETEADMVIENVQRYYPYLDISDFKDEDITALLLNDKKNTDSKINFSLISGIGSCTYDHQCSQENIIESLSFYRKLNNA